MINLVDVGGAGGLQPKWERHLDRVNPVIFECNPKEAESIRNKYAEKANVTVVQKGLYNDHCRKTLHLTKHFGCTSLLEPDFEVLKYYPIAKQFEVLGEESIECVRYDKLYSDKIVPQPDVIKIDVQGCEYQVLEGFGELLHAVVGIELESHLYPIYKGQRLLHDLIALLGKYGLVLQKLRPIAHFEGDLVEVDAFFVKSRSTVDSLDARSKENLKLVRSVFEL